MEQCYGGKQYGLERQAVRRNYGSIVHKEMGKRALGVVVKAPAGKVGVLSVHLPPKATIAETGVITSEERRDCHETAACCLLRGLERDL